MKDTYKVASNIAWRKVEDEIVALDVESSLYFSFNDVGSRIWEALAESATLEQAVSRVADEFDADPKEIEKDAREFVRGLCKDKLLLPA